MQSLREAMSCMDNVNQGCPMVLLSVLAASAVFAKVQAGRTGCQRSPVLASEDCGETRHSLARALRASPEHLFHKGSPPGLTAKGCGEEQRVGRWKDDIQPSSRSARSSWGREGTGAEEIVHLAPNLRTIGS